MQLARKKSFGLVDRALVGTLLFLLLLLLGVQVAKADGLNSQRYQRASAPRASTCTNGPWVSVGE